MVPTIILCKIGSTHCDATVMLHRTVCQEQLHDELGKYMAESAFQDPAQSSNAGFCTMLLHASTAVVNSHIPNT